MIVARDRFCIEKREEYFQDNFAPFLRIFYLKYWLFFGTNQFVYYFSSKDNHRKDNLHFFKNILSQIERFVCYFESIKE